MINKERERKIEAQLIKYVLNPFVGVAGTSTCRKMVSRNSQYAGVIPQETAINFITNSVVETYRQKYESRPNPDKVTKEGMGRGFLRRWLERSKTNKSIKSQNEIKLKAVTTKALHTAYLSGKIKEMEAKSKAEEEIRPYREELKATESIAPRQDPLGAIEFFARLYAKDMVADYNPAFFRSFLWFAKQVLIKNLSKNLVMGEERPGLFEKIRALEKEYAIVYTPNHLSNVDHVPVILGLNSNGLRQPSIFAGENLYKDSTNIILPLFNVRKMKRKVMVTYDDLIRSQEAKTVLGWMKKEAFVDVKDPKKEGIPWASNHIYKDCDRVYTHLQLSSKEPILFYIEGGRSRSGALEEPKAGILYDVMDYVLQSREKVCFVPIAISYTTVPEDKSIEESRRGKNISEGNLIAQIVKLDYSVKKGAKTYFTVCEPMIVGPEDLAGAHALSDFGYKIMAAIGRGIVNVDTYLLAAALILNQKYTYKTQDALTFMGTISAMVGEETDSNKLEKKLASATKNFLARGFIEKEGDHYRIMNMPLIEQYANRIKHKMPKTLIS